MTIALVPPAAEIPLEALKVQFWPPLAPLLQPLDGVEVTSKEDAEE